MQETTRKETYKDFLFIYLGTAEDKAIVLTDQRMKSLENLIDGLKNDPMESIKGIIFTSPPEMAFCVGADLKSIKEVTNPEIGKKLAQDGQRIFAKIENLQKPTFAAIQGHCVGGGCELALACDFRLIANDTKSRIGLPETKLGILPGFGGTQRLPKLIGLPKAIDFITSAKVISAKVAANLGIVDGFIELEADKISKDTIVESCLKMLKQPKISKQSFLDKILSNNPIGRSIVNSKANKVALSKTKGKYPAIPLSIKSILNSYNLESDAAYDKEAEYLGELIVSPESKSLVHIFYLTEFASKLGKKSSGRHVIKSVGIIGAGVMGRGIAAVALKNRLKVSVADTNGGALQDLKGHVEKFIHEARSIPQKDKNTVLSNLTTTLVNKDLNNSDLIIEAATENLDIKQKIFSAFSNSTHSDQVIATNTSSLQLSNIFKDITNKESCIGIHFFNPVEKMPLIEIVRNKETSDQTVLQACSFASKLGKYPIVVEDVPGFLVNRILAPYLAESSALVKEGASFFTIERALTNFGFPMGAFRLLDEVGIDVAAKVQEVLSEGYGTRMIGAGYLETLLSKNLLGKKSGAGFYLHNANDVIANTNLLNELGITTESSNEKITEEEILERILVVMIFEALRAYEEEVAGKLGSEAIGQIDLASVMGFGFPPFHGGVLFYAKKIGMNKIISWANKYQAKGERFKIPQIAKDFR